MTTPPTRTTTRMPRIGVRTGLHSRVDPHGRTASESGDASLRPTALSANARQTYADAVHEADDVRRPGRPPTPRRSRSARWRRRRRSTRNGTRTRSRGRRRDARPAAPGCPPRPRACPGPPGARSGWPSRPRASTDPPMSHRRRRPRSGRSSRWSAPRRRPSAGARRLPSIRSSRRRRRGSGRGSRRWAGCRAWRPPVPRPARCGRRAA